MKIIKGVVLLWVAMSAFSGCVSESDVNNDELVVRLGEEPERLNPIISRSSISHQIEYLIFQPLAEIDPISLEFEAVLLEKMPMLVQDERDDLGVVDRLDLRIRPGARWTDGTPVTYRDVLFTFKTIFNKEVGAARFRSRLMFIKGENHDENDPTFLTFYLDTAVFAADKLMTNFHMLPAHIYDSIGYMKNISLGDLITDNITAEQKQRLKDFATSFTTEKFSRQKVVGSGPYKLENWNTGYEIKLIKKEDWWGRAHEERNLFKAIPESIVYKVIPDEQLAVTSLANDNVDLIAGLNPEKFDAMRESVPDKYQFLTPKIPQFFYIILNNKSPLLSDVRVRRALAHLVDQNKMIDVVMAGYGVPLTAPMPPDGKLYNKNVKPYHFNPEKASEFLTAAGWNDSDDDGYVDQEINGEHQELELRIYITGGALGRKIALLIQDNAKKAGVDIKIVSQKFSQSMEDMRSGNFEMVATAGGQSFWEPNLRPTWHSSGYASDGDNFAGYTNQIMDDLLDELESEEDIADRVKLYHKFHQQLNEDVPVLYLLMPTERLLVSNEWQVDLSARRPGYFENLIYPK